MSVFIHEVCVRKMAGTTPKDELVLASRAIPASVTIATNNSFQSAGQTSESLPLRFENFKTPQNSRLLMEVQNAILVARNKETCIMDMILISKLVGALSPVNHKGLHQG